MTRSPTIAPLPDSMPDHVREAFAAYDTPTAAALLELRQLILTTAAETEDVGAITETLKWGQPSYLTDETRSGSTIRLAPTAATSDHDYALFFICTTNLVEQFRTLFGDALDYEDNRAVVFSIGQTVPVDLLRQCIVMALTYHVGNA